MWRHGVSGQNVVWRSANAALPLPLATVANQQWRVVAISDFSGDNVSDILWRNTANGANALWRSGNAAAPLPVTGVGNLSWNVAGAGEFDAPDPNDPMDPGGGYDY